MSVIVNSLFLFPVKITEIFHEDIGYDARRNMYIVGIHMFFFFCKVGIGRISRIKQNG